MQNVTAERFTEFQKLELAWWANARFNPQVEWKFYFAVFGPYLHPFKRVADVGCGPVPAFMHPSVEASQYVAIDPLWEEYVKLERYTQWHTRQVDRHYADVDQVPSHQFDGVFCLNALDHVRNPLDTLRGLQRVLSIGGLMFLFVDLDKTPDQLHPHLITQSWLMQELSQMETLLAKNDKSWKFNNRVLYYVGKKVS